MDVALAAGVVAPGTEADELAALLDAEPTCQWRTASTQQPLCSAPATWQGTSRHDTGTACRAALACDKHRAEWIATYTISGRLRCRSHRERLTHVSWRPL